MAQGRGLYARSARARLEGARPRDHHRAAPDRRRRARLARADHRQEPSRAGARVAAQAHERDRHQGRSDHARGVQQPVHVDRRADGRVAAEHRLFGQHQGAARLLLRGVRADGTLVANAPHMPVHLGSMDRAVETIIRENKGRIAPGDVYVINAPYNGGTHLPDITVCTPVFDDRKKHILFWVASRGHHADVGGISPGSMSPMATTIEEEGVLFDNFKVIDRGRFREKELDAALTGAKYPVPQSAAERQRHEGADRRQRKGRAGAAQDGGAFHHAGGEGLHAARAGQRRRKRAPRHRPAARQRIRLRDGPGHRDQGQDHGRQEEARGDRRFHRHLAAAEDQLQRARARHPRRRALRLPRDGRRRHPDERGLPAPDQHHHSPAIAAAAGVSVRRGRGQRRDLAGRHRHAVRRARRDGRGARHDEQPQLRQREAISTTRRSAPALPRVRDSPAPTRCTRT